MLITFFCSKKTIHKAFYFALLHFYYASSVNSWYKLSLSCFLKIDISAGLIFSGFVFKTAEKLRYSRFILFNKNVSKLNKLNFLEKNYCFFNNLMLS